MTTPASEFTAALEQRQLLNVDATAPRLLASVGSHVLNLRHRGAPLTITSGGPRAVESDFYGPVYATALNKDLRSHLLIVGEPGTGKSIWGYQMFDDSVGLMDGAIPYKWEGRVTEAGLVGQKVPDGKGKPDRWERGHLWHYRNDVLFFSEMSNMNAAMRSSHSSNLINTMLEALESGKVVTAIGNVDDEYTTRCTLIGGVQPERFEEVTGFERRFTFLRNPPPVGEWVKKYKVAANRAENVKIDREALSSCRQAFKDRVDEIKDIEHVAFSPELITLLEDDKRVSNTSDDTVKKAIMGYYVMAAKSISSTLTIPRNLEVIDFINEYLSNRSMVMTDPDVFNILWDNTEPTMKVYGIIQKDLKMSRNKAEKSVKECVDTYMNRGLRYVVVRKPGDKSTYYRIPTGVPINRLKALGWRVVREEGVTPGVAIKRYEEPPPDDYDVSWSMEVGT